MTAGPFTWAVATREGAGERFVVWWCIDIENRLRATLIPGTRPGWWAIYTHLGQCAGEIRGLSDAMSVVECEDYTPIDPERWH